MRVTTAGWLELPTCRAVKSCRRNNPHKSPLISIAFFLEQLPSGLVLPEKSTNRQLLVRGCSEQTCQGSLKELAFPEKEEGMGCRQSNSQLLPGGPEAQWGVPTGGSRGHRAYPGSWLRAPGLGAFPPSYRDHRPDPGSAGPRVGFPSRDTMLGGVGGGEEG